MHVRSSQSHWLAPAHHTRQGVKDVEIVDIKPVFGLARSVMNQNEDNL